MSSSPGESFNKVHFVQIDDHASGQRIDNFLLRYLKGVPKSHIYRVLRKGEVRINKKRAKPTQKLLLGDEVRIPPIRVAADQATIAPKAQAVEMLEKRVLFENAHFLVVNKPSGLAVHSGSGVQHGVIELFRASRPEADFLELVHRIDRETSGCLLLAKSRKSLLHFQAQLQSHQWHKSYLALLLGQWTAGEREIRSVLGRDRDQTQDRSVRSRDVGEGKIAISVFKPMTVFQGFSLMEVDIETGRTHQIRVQAAEAGFPIAGDKKYGDFSRNRELQKQGLKRLFLHAASLSFISLDGKRYQFKAPLPDELTRFLKTCHEI